MWTLEHADVVSIEQIVVLIIVNNYVITITYQIIICGMQLNFKMGISNEDGNCIYPAIHTHTSFIMLLMYC
jgi:hypothetical protein